MSRLQLRAPKVLRRRPLRARRATVAHDTPMEYSPRSTPRWVVVGTGVLGGLVAVELLAAVTVLA